MKKYVLIAIIVWISVVSISLIWNLKTEKENQDKLAYQAAQNLFKQIVLTRTWNANHGGVYVPVTDDFFPNPYLKDSLRDVITTDSFKLTKINPAFMTRQIGEIASKESNMRFHITSLKPIRPENAATDWETKALNNFEKGENEYGNFLTNSASERIFHYMAPLITKKSCLKCHAQQGYKEGDIRGGISVTFPLEKEGLSWQLWLSHILALIVGLIAFLIFGNYIERKRTEILKKNEKLQESVEVLKKTQSKLQKSEQIVEMQKGIKSFITTAQYLTNLTSYQNVRTEIVKIVKSTFKADFICFADKNSLGEINVLRGHTDDCELLQIIEETKEEINDVIESEFLSTFKVTEPTNYSMAILPLTIGYSVVPT